METFLIKALQLVLSLSILVIVHEFGHFIFARIYKVRVEKFYLFFNPWFSLFKFKPKNSETEYGIGWLPLGGYVKISGMIDESMDKEQMAQPEQPWEFRSKPAGQRLMIMVAGVLFNFLLALFIYSMITFTWGETYLPLQNAKAGMVFNDAAHQIGFQDGDLLLSVDGKPLERMTGESLREIIEGKEVRVWRNGKEVSVYIPDNFMLSLLDEKKPFADFITPVVIDSVLPESGALQAGLMAGDSIVAVNASLTRDRADLREALVTLKNDTAHVSFFRNGVEMQAAVSVDSAGMIGMSMKSLSQIYPLKTVKYGFWESFPRGIERGMKRLSSYVGDMKYLFTKEGAKSLGGFGTLGSIFPSAWNWQMFWEMTAFLSIALAFMNILPIPALDGGHVLFLLYEVIARRKPSDKFLEYAQMVGMFLLFGLLLLANGNDIIRFVFN